MVRTVIREHHWSPDFVSEMYIDETDIFGLEFWYEDIKETCKPKGK